MPELQTEISYWLSVAYRAVQAFPTFIGNNWVGVLLSFSLFVAATRPRIKDHVAAVRVLGWTSKLSYTGRALMKTNWRIVGMIVGAFYFINFLTVAFRDYSAISGQNKNAREQLTATQSQLAASKVTCQLQTGDIRGERDTERAKNQTLEKQNRDEQVLIAGCQNQAMKLLTPEPLHITTLAIGTGITSTQVGKPTSKAIVIVATTNQTITPIRATLECEYPIDSIAPPGLAGVAGDTVWQTSISRGRPSNTKIEAYIDSPAWRPSQVLAFPIMSTEPGPGKCNITQSK